MRIQCISCASIYERNRYMYIELCLKYIKFTPEKFIKYLVTKAALNSSYQLPLSSQRSRVNPEFLLLVVWIWANYVCSELCGVRRTEVVGVGAGISVRLWEVFQGLKKKLL